MGALAIALVGQLAVPLPASASAPSVSIGAPTVDGDAGWYRDRPVFSLTAEDTADGIQSLEASFVTDSGTDTTPFSYAAPYPTSVSETVQPARPGEQTLEVTATDGTGATASASHAFKWDPDPPSQPTNPRWIDGTGLLVESVSPDEQICARWDGSTDAVSGLRTYRVQIAESPDFATPVVDSPTGSIQTNACFGSSDGVRSGRSYYFRVLARDHAGNPSAWSSASNRVDVTDQTTGPALVHAPVTSGYFGEPIPISLKATCEGDGPCSARLFYRTTPNTGAGGVVGDGWTRVDLAEGDATTVEGRSAIEWTGTIPGAAATSAGVDYFVEAEDTFALTQMPGGTFVGSGEATGIQPAAHSFSHVAVVSPPLLAHTPPPFARDGEPIPLELSATCSSGACDATLYYRTSTDSVADETLTAAPDWPRLAMTETGEPTSLGDAGARLTFHGEIPADAVDTRGVDYVFSVTDGATTTWWPGTPPQGYYASLDGMRTAYHHVHALEPPHAAHTPVTTAPYREPIAVDARANCTSGSCSGTLY